MTNSQRLSLVRQCLTQWLVDHATVENETEQTGDDPSVPGQSGAAPPPKVRESILIRDGFYCGRRFDAGTHEAVWFMEEDELKISDVTGDLLCVFVGEEIGAAVRSAQAQVEQAPEVSQIAAERPVTEVPIRNELESADQAAVVELTLAEPSVHEPSETVEPLDRQNVISIADHRTADRPDDSGEEIRRAA